MKLKDGISTYLNSLEVRDEEFIAFYRKSWWLTNMDCWRLAPDENRHKWTDMDVYRRWVLPAKEVSSDKLGKLSRANMNELLTVWEESSGTFFLRGGGSYLVPADWTADDWEYRIISQNQVLSWDHGANRDLD